ncbi:RNA polymerase sigma factor (sigma-70 family) [Aquimarina sp. EL_43]|uniref:RNA polymerase sigma factor n=1 Tax=Aquimarina TaxID=290174 RepID=UPI00046E6E16|nr:MULTISPECIES: sigma-70 family RNA polymerase sigma factor [Aquimarina]MBG6130474.1 RNA polymerase sigma factor (sigma-70 family) [Aquimarina sp. EL_35]MBG6149254.1 RNA polymerase sigma factor (sigma-70 family) [Aquimarina sp. EL_32]MBG6168372.1 RNA polymerase sigma factor (sigma-70 family) [Aquimarina sp. EL_43]
MNTTEDHKILEGIVTGNEVVITTFYRKNLPYIRQYILQNSGNEEDAEDVFQDALILVYQKLKTDSLELHSSLRTYFYGICKNMWRNRLRKNKKMIITEKLPEDAEIITPTVIQDIEYKEREHIYRRHFLKLSDTCREVLSLLFQGNSMKDIAHITGYSEGYTRKKKFECKRYLIEMIEKDHAFQELQLNPEKEL